VPVPTFRIPTASARPKLVSRPLRHNQAEGTVRGRESIHNPIDRRPCHGTWLWVEHERSLCHPSAVHRHQERTEQGDTLMPGPCYPLHATSPRRPTLSRAALEQHVRARRAPAPFRQNAHGGRQAHNTADSDVRPWELADRAVHRTRTPRPYGFRSRPSRRATQVIECPDRRVAREGRCGCHSLKRLVGVELRPGRIAASPRHDPRRRGSFPPDLLRSRAIA